MNRDDLIKRLLQLDEDMLLIDNSDDMYTCVIVGGGALVLMNKIIRSTHDIDAINASAELQPFLESYNINMNVNAFCLNFLDGYLNRIVKVNIPTKKVNFYTLSLEDLVVSKLNSNRTKDIEDLSNKSIYENINWEILDKLIEDTCYGMLNESDETLLRNNYDEYKEKYCNA